jgi:hypothetical protein
LVDSPTCENDEVPAGPNFFKTCRHIRSGSRSPSLTCSTIFVATNQVAQSSRSAKLRTLRTRSYAASMALMVSGSNAVDRKRYSIDIEWFCEQIYMFWAARKTMATRELGTSDTDSPRSSVAGRSLARLKQACAMASQRPRTLGRSDCSAMVRQTRSREEVEAVHSMFSSLTTLTISFGAAGISCCNLCNRRNAQAHSRATEHKA